MAFSTHINKILPALHIQLFWIGNNTYFFLEKGRNMCQLQSLLFVILLCYCHTMLFYSAILCLWAMVLIKWLLASPYQIFICFVYYFTITFFSPIRLLRKIMNFPKENKFVLSTHGWSILILLFIFLCMCFYGVFNRSAMVSRYYESIILLLHSFRSGLSSITWNNKEFVVWKLQIVVVFQISEETTFKVDTTSITLSYFYPFGKEVFF